MDAALRDELRGWYHIKRRFVENEVGQRFYFDFYGAKCSATRFLRNSDRIIEKK
jgi:hypothetical protein